MGVPVHRRAPAHHRRHRLTHQSDRALLSNSYPHPAARNVQLRHDPFVGERLAPNSVSSCAPASHTRRVSRSAPAPRPVATTTTSRSRPTPAASLAPRARASRGRHAATSLQAIWSRQKHAQTMRRVTPGRRFRGTMLGCRLAESTSSSRPNPPRPDEPTATNAFVDAAAVGRSQSAQRHQLDTKRPRCCWSVKAATGQA